MIRKWYRHFEEMQDTFLHFENLFIFQNVIVGNLPLGPYPFSIGHPINPYMADYFHITGPLEDCNSSSQSGLLRFEEREIGMQYVEFIN